MLYCAKLGNFVSCTALRYKISVLVPQTILTVKLVATARRERNQFRAITLLVDFYELFQFDGIFQDFLLKFG
eukprot:1951276-Rhodomonas_salina.3